MVINGKKLAERVYDEVKMQANALSERGITPHLAIITAGNEDTWQRYVTQKLKIGEHLGIQTSLHYVPKNSEELLLIEIEKHNDDDTVHGIIVQRPLDSAISVSQITNAVKNEKDVDGFRDGSIYKAPVWLGVKRIISHHFQLINDEEFRNSLANQAIVVIGKGETGGKPVIQELEKLGCKLYVIDSKTENRTAILSHADIVISAVGKREVVTPKDIKPGVLLIGIGIHTEEGKLVGDYTDSDMESTKAIYTPTPGGTGPLTVAYLFKNTVDAALRITAGE